MRVVDVDTGVFKVPTKHEVSDSIHRSSGFEWVIARVRTDEGLEGTGWSYTLGEGAHSIKALIDHHLRDLLLGTDPADVQSLQDRMWRATHVIGSSGVSLLAIAALDIALWDLVGQRYGLPLYRLLGRHRDTIPVYVSSMDLNHSIEELVAEKSEFVAQGFRGFKMKAGSDDVRRDIERIRVVRETIGDDADLMIDINQKWTVPDALYRGRFFEGEDITWLEEPLLADDYDGYEQLARSIRIPIAAGETHYTKYQFKELLTRGAIQVLQADVCRVGGITEWMKIAHLAEAWNIPMAPHFVEELHVHLLCAVSNGLVLEYLPAASLNASGVVTNPVKIDQGVACPHEDPGHGVRLDWELLDRYATS